jgi:GH24 family phage-related lysozyme (muramidase)
MTINYTLLTQNNYSDQRYDLIKLYEGLRLFPYDPGDTFATIGIGFNIETSSNNRSIVIETIAANNTSLRADLNSIITNNASSPVSTVKALLDTKMTSYSNANPALGLRKAFAFADETEVKAAFARIATDYNDNFFL